MRAPDCKGPSTAPEPLAKDGSCNPVWCGGHWLLCHSPVMGGVTQSSPSAAVVLGCFCLGMQRLLAEAPQCQAVVLKGPAAGRASPCCCHHTLRLLALPQASWSLTSPSWPPWHSQLLGSLVEVAAGQDVAACPQPPLLIDWRSARGQQHRRLRVLKPSCEGRKAAPHKHQGADWPVAQFRWLLSPM